MLRGAPRSILLITLLLCSATKLWAASVPGGVYTWPVPRGASDVRYHDKPVFTYQNHAFVGISIKAQPGTEELTYLHNGATHTHAFPITGKQYTEQRLQIKNRAMVNPPEDTLARIRSEAVRQRKLYNSHTEAHNLDQGFILPLQGIVTSLFGHRRILNGQARNPHSGLDIAADTGTPIMAPAGGVVVLADDLYFNGKTLFIDHGRGLVTMYCHLSEILSEVGQVVAQGEEIGLVGATGRVTGPHLHWSVSLNGNRVDPQVFMALLNDVAIPEPAAAALP
ncbi:MAG: M23 family metallopeptidase [Pseudomonadota bacterium]